MSDKIMKAIFELQYVFFMCCNLIALIGLSVTVVVKKLTLSAQYAVVLIAVICGMAFCKMLKDYLSDKYLNK